ncbi:hypothetical protein AYI68_g2636 [Smittium mucronatum]|uniref:Uncharacterized protein n=1 Tax=Smittium mucronatum TaxID=133383 RepID=A0A1R0H294_9FUNG|nr:hypothetical protein AYI68_g2636 [Smittium mucronatum]
MVGSDNMSSGNEVVDIGHGGSINGGEISNFSASGVVEEYIGGNFGQGGASSGVWTDTSSSLTVGANQMNNFAKANSINSGHYSGVMNDVCILKKIEYSM